MLDPVWYFYALQNRMVADNFRSSLHFLWILVSLMFPLKDDIWNDIDKKRNVRNSSIPTFLWKMVWLILRLEENSVVGNSIQRTSQEIYVALDKHRKDRISINFPSIS